MPCSALSLSGRTPSGFLVVFEEPNRRPALPPYTPPYLSPCFLFLVVSCRYYHNINGSLVTGQSPFEIWLNEAVTVHIQRQREVGASVMRASVRGLRG